MVFREGCPKKETLAKQRLVERVLQPEGLSCAERCWKDRQCDSSWVWVVWGVGEWIAEPRAGFHTWGRGRIQCSLSRWRITK